MEEVLAASNIINNIVENFIKTNKNKKFLISL